MEVNAGEDAERKRNIQTEGGKRRGINVNVVWELKRECACVCICVCVSEEVMGKRQKRQIICSTAEK